jgi:hypothetical protein
MALFTAKSLQWVMALGAKMEELADPHVEVVVVLVPVLEGDGFTDFVG